jgi:fido (protein-threonine AMPylation protein)
MFFGRTPSAPLTGKAVAFGMNEAAGLRPSSFLKKAMPEEALAKEDAAGITGLISALDRLYKNNAADTMAAMASGSDKTNKDAAARAAHAPAILHVTPAPGSHAADTMDCDYTSVRILQIYGETGFDFSVNYLLALHTRLFSDFRPAAGAFRKDKVAKAPGKYDNHDWLTAPEEIPAALARLFAAKHKAFMPPVLSGSAAFAPSAPGGSAAFAPSAPGESTVIVPLAPGGSVAAATASAPVQRAASPQELAAFSAGLWQIHPFAFGNTRTLVLFLIKYLQSAASGANISPLWEHAVSFREALIMANPEARAYGTVVITRPLESLFEIIL